MTTNTTWNGSSDNWDTAADWTGDVLPGVDDDAIVNSGQPQITTNDGTIAGLTVAGSLEFTGGALAVTGATVNSGSLYLDIYGD